MKRRSAGAVIALVVLALSACGGGSSNTISGTAPGSYANQVCTALVGALTKVKADVTSYASQVHQNRHASLTVIHSDAVSYYTSVVDQFAVMRDGIANAGTPAVTGGAAVRTKLLASFDQVLKAGRAAEADVRALAPKHPKSFTKKLSTYGEKLSTAGQSIGSALENTSLGGATLNSAFSKAAACKSLTTS